MVNLVNFCYLVSFFERSGVQYVPTKDLSLSGHLQGFWFKLSTQVRQVGCHTGYLQVLLIKGYSDIKSTYLPLLPKSTILKVRLG